MTIFFYYFFFSLTPVAGPGFFALIYFAALRGRGGLLYFRNVGGVVALVLFLLMLFGGLFFVYSIFGEYYDSLHTPPGRFRCGTMLANALLCWWVLEAALTVATGLALCFSYANVQKKLFGSVVMDEEDGSEE